MAIGTLVVTMDDLERLLAVDTNEEDAMYVYIETLEDEYTAGYLAGKLSFLSESMSDRDIKDFFIGLFQDLLGVRGYA